MTKGKIIKITEEIITIGMDNGTIKEVRRCDVDFTPKLEDLVDVFEDKDQVIVTRRKETSTSNAGININMTNSVHTGEYVATEGKKGCQQDRILPICISTWIVWSSVFLLWKDWKSNCLCSVFLDGNSMHYWCSCSNSRSN